MTTNGKEHISIALSNDASEINWKHYKDCGTKESHEDMDSRIASFESEFEKIFHRKMDP